MDDELRLLGRTGGYTDKSTKAMRSGGELEPEAVDAETQRRITLAAAQNWPHLDALQRGERRAKPLHKRLEQAKAQAKHLRIDVHRPVQLIEFALKGGRSHAHVERRIEALEAKVFPDRGGRL